MLLWQNSEQNQPKEGRVHVDSWFEGTVSTSCEEGMMTGMVTLSLLRKKREKDALLFVQSGTPDHGVVLLTFSLVFLSQISLEISSQTPLLPRTLAPR